MVCLVGYVIPQGTKSHEGNTLADQADAGQPAPGLPADDDGWEFKWDGSAHARGAYWVEPQLVGEVAFTEWTSDQVLRHPSWRGLRPGKNPDDLRPDS